MQQLHNKSFICLLSLILFSFFSLNALGQKIETKKDMDFFSSSKNLQSHFHKRDYIFNNEESALVKYNPVSMALGGLLYIYQNSISQQLSASCLFQPTCSDFSKHAIRDYGIFKGVFLSADRITRCNKIAGSDIHPLTINQKTKRSEDPISLYK
jgi:putative membrane protein insertion efficiency factor